MKYYVQGRDITKYEKVVIDAKDKNDAEDKYFDMIIDGFTLDEDMDTEIVVRKVRTKPIKRKIT